MFGFGAPVSESTQKFHQESLVVDLHNDTLLKVTHLGANLRKRHGPALYWNPLRLDIDLPRMREGGVDAMVFILFGAYRFDPRHRRFWRKLDAAERLVADREAGIALVKSADDLVGTRAKGALGMLLGVEGGEAIAAEPERLAELHARGVRSFGPLWNRTNTFGVAARDEENAGGLTARGRQLVRELNALGMMIDLAHASPRTIWEILEESRTAPYCSHTAAKALKPHWRNLDDGILSAIGRAGGVIGVIFCPYFLGGPLSSIERLAEHIEHVAEVAGPGAVALGSDFDGMIPLVRGLRDVRDLPRLTEVLRRRGWKEGPLRGLLGENFLAYLRRVCG